MRLWSRLYDYDEVVTVSSKLQTGVMAGILQALDAGKCETTTRKQNSMIEVGQN